jgi:hypothetical protein
LVFALSDITIWEPVVLTSLSPSDVPSEALLARQAHFFLLVSVVWSFVYVAFLAAIRVVADCLNSGLWHTLSSFKGHSLRTFDALFVCNGVLVDVINCHTLLTVEITDSTLCTSVVRVSFAHTQIIPFFTWTTERVHDTSILVGIEVEWLSTLVAHKFILGNPTAVVIETALTSWING